jgi:hypothetical protein
LKASLMANDRPAWRSSACRGSPDIDFATVREGQTNIDFIKTAGPMMAARPFQHDPASCHPAIPLLQLGHVLLNRSVELRCSAHALENVDTAARSLAETLEAVEAQDGRAPR